MTYPNSGEPRPVGPSSLTWMLARKRTALIPPAAFLD